MKVFELRIALSFVSKCATSSIFEIIIIKEISTSLLFGMDAIMQSFIPQTTATNQEAYTGR